MSTVDLYSLSCTLLEDFCFVYKTDDQSLRGSIYSS